MAPLCFLRLMIQINYEVVKNEIALICAKFGVHLINTSEVTSRKTKWPRFLPLPVYSCDVRTYFL